MTTTFAIIGLCTFYAPNVLERVADYRGLTTRCPDCAGYAERMLKVSDGRMTESDGDLVKPAKAFPPNPEPHDIRPDVSFG